MEAAHLACTRFALDRKAYDLELLEVTKLTSVADYFLICTGRSDTQVRAIAEHIDRTGAFGELPILADALEEAGCDNPAMLAHCRDPHAHVPGCWVLDAVLKRE